MEKSIESIWKEGVMQDELNALPRINNFYNMKSVSAVEQLLNHMRREMWALLPMGIAVSLMSYLLGNEFWPSLLTLPIFAAWFVIAYRQVKTMEEVPYEANCYAYLQSVKSKMERITKFNRQLSVWSVPVLLIPMLLYTYSNQYGKTFGEIFGLDNVGGSALWIFAIVPLAMLFAYGFFNLMAGIIGNKVSTKIRNLLVEMEALR